MVLTVVIGQIAYDLLMLAMSGGGDVFVCVVSVRMRRRLLTEQDLRLSLVKIPG